jgi:hypothetical protein
MKYAIWKYPEIISNFANTFGFRELCAGALVQCWESATQYCRKSFMLRKSIQNRHLPFGFRTKCTWL